MYIQHRELRKAFLFAWLGQVEALKSAPVVFTYRDLNGEVKSEAMVYSVPHVRVWGLSYRCGNKKCWGLPGDVTSKVKGHNHMQAKFFCLRCQWETEWISRPQ